MPSDTYNPERDVTPDFMETVSRWIESTGEVFVVMRYLRAAGSKDYALVNTADTFHQLVNLCPIGTDIIVFRDRQLPIRGHVNDEFIHDAKTKIADGMEYLCVCVSPEESCDPRLSGKMGDTHATLIDDLNDVHGIFVALGTRPEFTDPDNDVMISASKGGIDGPR